MPVAAGVVSHVELELKFWIFCIFWIIQGISEEERREREVMMSSKVNDVIPEIHIGFSPKPPKRNILT